MDEIALMLILSSYLKKYIIWTWHVLECHLKSYTVQWSRSLMHTDMISKEIDYKVELCANQSKLTPSSIWLKPVAVEDAKLNAHFPCLRTIIYWSFYIYKQFNLYHAEFHKWKNPPSSFGTQSIIIFRDIKLKT